MPSLEMSPKSVLDNTAMLYKHMDISSHDLCLDQRSF